MTNESGRIAFYTIAVGVLVFLLASVFDPFKFSSGEPYGIFAGTATTSVTVLNTPPSWQVDAQEYIESSTSTPTNVGSNAVWVGTASDDNAEPYYLLICKTSSTPTANAGAPPTCGGGASNQWAVSALTSANVQATSTYTALVGDAEENVWVAWICDRNASNPECNPDFKQGTGTSSSPFYVNHRPSFTGFVDSSPQIPGGVVTWFATSSDADVVGGNDTVRLFVCRANDFSGTSCGAGGTYCSSTLVSANPSCSSTLATPLQDRNWTSFGFVLDNHNFAASGGAHASDSVLTVSNVSPTISTSTITLEDSLSSTSSLTLTVGAGQTNNFKVKFTVADNNSCENASAGREISSAIVNVYRSGITQANCQTTGNYNPNNCYPAALATSTWNWSCSQDGGSCSGANDSDATWTCTFPIWFLADPTDGANATDTQFFAQNWLASVRATDDNGATTTLAETPAGNELLSFLSYTLNTASIAYGSLEPGERNDPIVATTTVSATGNVGLDETLYGTDMCTTFPTCATSTTSTVGVANQKYATSSVGYASSTAVSLALNPGAELEINILKPTATSTLTSGTTFWGIQIPGTITLAGDYTGQNTIIGVKGEAQSW